MFPGGLKETPYKDMMERNPDHVCSQNFLPILVAFIINLDYSPRRLRYAAEEQAPREAFGAVENIPWTTHGQGRR